jgi:hypothetical protein
MDSGGWARTPSVTFPKLRTRVRFPSLALGKVLVRSPLRGSCFASWLGHRASIARASLSGVVRRTSEDPAVPPPSVSWRHGKDPPRLWRVRRPRGQPPAGRTRRDHHPVVVAGCPPSSGRGGPLVGAGLLVRRPRQPGRSQRAVEAPRVGGGHAPGRCVSPGAHRL